MSKQRAQRRAQREAIAARRHRDNAAEQQRAAARRDRAHRRSRTWRRVRLWRGSGGRSREQWAVFAAVALIVVLGVWFVTRSVGAVVLLALVLVVAGPALIVLTGPRRR